MCFLYKISPNPSLPKRGNQGEALPKRGNHRLSLKPVLNLCGRNQGEALPKREAVYQDLPASSQRGEIRERR